MPVRMAIEIAGDGQIHDRIGPGFQGDFKLAHFAARTWFWKGEVPMLALTLTRVGWPDDEWAPRPAWAGLPSRTMVPASMAQVMASGARPSYSESAAKCAARRP